MKLANGTVFEGNFLNGKKHGAGTFHWDDDSSFKGSFKDDKMEG